MIGLVRTRPSEKMKLVLVSQVSRGMLTSTALLGKEKGSAADEHVASPRPKAAVQAAFRAFQKDCGT